MERNSMVNNMDVFAMGVRDCWETGDAGWKPQKQTRNETVEKQLAIVDVKPSMSYAGVPKVCVTTP